MLQLKGEGQTSGKRIFVMPSIQMRDIDIKDAQAYFELYTSPEITKYLPDDMIPENINAAVEQIDSLFLRGRPYPYWAVIDQETDYLIGTCGFVNADYHNKRLEIAYELHPKVWGRGIIHHSIKTSLKYAFEKMKIQRVEAVIMPDNSRSQRTLERAGFTYEGILRNYKFFRGRMRDVKSYSITPEDFYK